MYKIDGLYRRFAMAVIGVPMTAIAQQIMDKSKRFYFRYE